MNDDISQIRKEIKDLKKQVDKLTKFMNQQVGVSNANSENERTLYLLAVKVVKSQDKASTSLLQRNLSIGYAKAARLLDELEENGIISAPDETGVRRVIKSIKN